MGEPRMDRLSDAGSIPARSIKIRPRIFYRDRIFCAYKRCRTGDFFVKTSRLSLSPLPEEGRHDLFLSGKYARQEDPAVRNRFPEGLAYNPAVSGYQKRAAVFQNV